MALLTLQKNSIENLDKTKSCSRLKFFICLHQREIIYILLSKTFVLKLVSNANEDFGCSFTSPTVQILISHKSFIRACIFSKFVE